jgi:hypothetical protein
MQISTADTGLPFSGKQKSYAEEKPSKEVNVVMERSSKRLKQICLAVFLTKTHYFLVQKKHWAVRFQKQCQCLSYVVSEWLFGFKRPSLTSSADWPRNGTLQKGQNPSRKRSVMEHFQARARTHMYGLYAHEAGVCSFVRLCITGCATRFGQMCAFKN